MPGAKVNIKWKGRKFMAGLRREMAARRLMAAQVVRDQVVVNLSTSTRSAGPSAPGEMPHADSGDLRKSVFAADDPAAETAIVGVKAQHGGFLQFGTSRMAARPYLDVTLRQMRSVVKKILTKKITRKLS